MDNPVDRAFPIRADYRTSLIRVYGGVKALLWVKVMIPLLTLSLTLFCAPHHLDKVIDYIERL